MMVATKKSDYIPIDFHCHGVGRFDFTEITELALQDLEESLRKKNIASILTLYLPRSNFDDFIKLLDKYNEGQKQNKYPHIAGFALEGPLLGSFGGTPKKTLWPLTKRQWQKLASYGNKGLKYVIFSPDAELPKSNAPKDDLDVPPDDLIWITDTLLKGGVLPALGHFYKTNPKKSAEATQAILNFIEKSGKGPIVTDHLYNDMPLNFKNAWRTTEQKKHRDEELAAIHLENWSLDTLEENVGIVPATLIRAALKGLVKLCLNFDGEHVDLAIVKKTVELVGAENIMVMTDSIESKVLAGRYLHKHKGTTLLYQEDDIVAAGSQNMAKQIKNMRKIGLTDEQIRKITFEVPADILKIKH